ncbi:hypothetical protein EZV73_04770 [Acidaminobacter sp. JC074]|uniref:hypothetical protein n=1 Tax=Acidaminobacter sp. JC074 TaxID=2530199 RepID=UPI001F10BE5A|nr:hypothetical protein [Acidaminobacter sp. JC074]MCH4886867.1 hypothetical protein [Acidaminobacter sp. JC074]
MNGSDKVKYIEKLVNPIHVGTLHFIQSFNNLIPKNVQKKMVQAQGKKTPYMGFVVEPYSSFLFYELKNLEYAKSFLPEGFELMKSKVFDDDDEKFYGILGSFTAHTSGFWGMRTEFYVIARNMATDMLSWIIIDYDTNTITYDPKNILSDPNVDEGIFTVDFNGQLHVDMINQNGRKIIYDYDVKKGRMEALDRRLWIEGNLSIAYGTNKVDDDPGVFSLIFDPKEFNQALRVPSEVFNMKTNNWFPGLIEDAPSVLVCFPFSQHFLSDSPGHSSQLKSEEELIEKHENVDYESLNVFSTKSFKASILIGGILSLLTNSILLLLYILK